MTVQHLQDTGVGKTINSLRKSDGEVGEAARALVLKWKQMVEDESENEPESSAKFHAHSSYNGDSENENPGEKFDRRDKGNPEKSLRDKKELSKHNHAKSQKRKKESDHNGHKEKKHRSDDDFSNHTSISNSRRNVESVGSDGEWSANCYKNGDTNSDDDTNFISSLTKEEMHSSFDQNLPSEDDLDNEHLAPSSVKESSHRKEEDARRQLKSSKKEKSSSHKHKSKSSTGSSDKSKHLSSSRSEHKSSSSSKHKEEKKVSGSNSSLKKNEAEKSEERSKSKDKKEKHKHRSKEDKNSKEKNGDEDGVDSFSGLELS